MKLCLISPPMTVVSNAWRYPQVPPLGIAYLAASAREAGHDVTIVDGLDGALGTFHPFIQGRYINGLTIDEIVQRVPRGTEVIGVSIMFSSHWPLARRLLAALRTAFPSTTIVVGGEHVTAVTQHVFDSSPVDYAVLGEGEETLLELLDALCGEGTVDIRQVEGLAYRASSTSRTDQPGADIHLELLDNQRQGIVRTPSRVRRRNLDSIPWPAWDLFPIQDYLQVNRYHEFSDRRVMTMLGTRGCPYRCRFCSSPQMWGTNFYMRSPKDLVDEMEFYKNKYGATEFQFQDLTFVVNRRWVLRVAQEICSRNLNITWKLPAGTRSEAFDAEVLAKLCQSGCRSLTFAPESGSKRVLADMLKKADPARILELGRIVRRERIDMMISANIIIGSPKERLRDLLQTYFYIIRLALVGYDSILCSRFTLYPGSEYHRRSLGAGLVEYDDNYFLDMEVSLASLRSGRSWHPRWSDRTIRRLTTVGYFLFFAAYYFSRPLRMLRSVIAVLRNVPRTRIEVVFAHGLMRRVRQIAALLPGRRAARSI
ncbi:MAG: B12-binding domain-containing radical SAM protein [Planctomycetes bacterium]|nr:B12-binding domain-containing radical SAM protein [Planctomycetota bacterium]